MPARCSGLSRGDSFTDARQILSFFFFAVVATAGAFKFRLGNTNESSFDWWSMEAGPEPHRNRSLRARASGKRIGGALD